MRNSFRVRGVKFCDRDIFETTPGRERKECPWKVHRLLSCFQTLRRLGQQHLVQAIAAVSREVRKGGGEVGG